MKKEDLKIFREDFKNALKEVEKKYNISFAVGVINYETRGNEVFKLKFKTECTSLETSSDAEEVCFQDVCRIYGFKETDYKKTFLLSGKTYFLIGFNTKARAYPIMAQEVQTGKRVRIGRAFLDFVRENLK
jgi:hypothetical protein